uniref:Ciliogenesis-associated TTC17-interacting protein n=1 Tax=Dicentrarchus labrax TaxID=13489 RepID=A0A8P4GBS0_DICLA
MSKRKSPPLVSEPAELQRCVFPDSLVTVSEGGRDLGKFSVTVEFARRGQQPCVLLHAQSQGAIDDSPLFLCPFLDKRCHMVQRDGQMVIDRVTIESVSHPMSVLRGLVTEGSNLLLMRLIALKKEVPEHMTFISLDQGLNIIHTTFLGLKQLEIGAETVEVFGVERTVHSVEDSPTSWQCYFLADGHLATRMQVGSPVTMRLLHYVVFTKIPLVWEEDMQMRSQFLDRKEELKGDHASYLRQHPEIRALISDFLQFLLLRKPDDIFPFAREYFLPFASHRPPEPSLKAPSL